MSEKNYLSFEDTFPLKAVNMVSSVKLLNPYDPPENRRTATARAVWDTGATLCSISRSLCDKLGLRPLHEEYVRTYNKPEGFKQQYDRVLISLFNGPYVLWTIAFVSDAIPGDYDMIIGKVIIASGSFSLKVEGDYIHMRLDVDPHYKFLKKLENFTPSQKDIP